MIRPSKYVKTLNKMTVKNPCCPKCGMKEEQSLTKESKDIEWDFWFCGYDACYTTYGVQR